MSCGDAEIYKTVMPYPMVQLQLQHYHYHYDVISMVEYPTEGAPRNSPVLCCSYYPPTARTPVEQRFASKNDLMLRLL